MELFLTLVIAMTLCLSTVHSEHLAAPDVNSRIVGGSLAQPGELPYQLSLIKSGVHNCGASLLEPGKVLTAAHCVAGVPKEQITVLAGTTKINSFQPPAQTRGVRRIITHPRYNPTNLENDIAVVFLTTNFNLTPYVYLIKPQPQDVSTSGNFTVSGWGARSETGPPSVDLNKVVVPLVPDARCQSDYPGQVRPDMMMCAGFDQGGPDACRFDDGGPLVSSPAGRPPVVVGVVSWGLGCGRPNKPHVYTKVSYYTTWIMQQQA